MRLDIYNKNSFDQGDKLPRPKTKPKAYCSSYACAGYPGRCADHNIKTPKNVSLQTVFCPDCSYALVWLTENL